MANCPPESGGQRDCKAITRGVENIAREADYIVGNDLFDSKVIPFLSRLWVNILDNTIRVCTEKSFDKAVELRDVLFGPLDLDSRIGRPMHGA